MITPKILLPFRAELGEGMNLFPDGEMRWVDLPRGDAFIWDGDNGPDMDAYGGVPYTVQDCKNDIAAGKACQPITVAVPQDLRDKGLLKPKTVVTWDEAARKYGLPPVTRFILSDVYGCYWSNTRKRYDGVNACDIGRTKTGGFSFDVAGCSRVRNKVCTVPTNSYSNLPPPKPVPGG